MEATEQRAVSPFNKVDLRGIGRLIVSRDQEQSVTVTGAENVLPRLRTEVRDGVLNISLRWWPGILFHLAELRTIEVQIAVKELSGLKVSGAGFVESREKIEVQELDLRLTGAGEIRLELQGQRIETRLAGAGRIVLWGQVDEQNIRLSGAGSIQAENLVAGVVQVRSTGAGECRVHATESLDVRLSGAGTIRYRGNPRLQSRISGVGTLSAFELYLKIGCYSIFY